LRRYQRFVGAVSSRYVKSIRKMIVSAASMEATSHQDWDSNGSAISSAMFAMDMTEIARMKNSYVVLFRSPRPVSLKTRLTRRSSRIDRSFPPSNHDELGGGATSACLRKRAGMSLDGDEQLRSDAEAEGCLRSLAPGS
jgi:hypothetical protein